MPKMEVPVSWLLGVAGLVCVLGYPDYPANEYEYSVKRQWLKEDERLYEGKVNDLTQVILCLLLLAFN